MDSNNRNFVVGSIVLHFKWELSGEKEPYKYGILNFGISAETLEEIVVYQSLQTGKVWVRDLKDFKSLVDKEKYPNIKQKYRFEILN